jgi:hypothetical protein
LRERQPVRLDGIDTGTLPGDLREVARLLGGRADRDMAVIRALSHAVERDPDLARAFQDSFVRPGFNALQHMFDRAVSRGEVDPKRPARAFLPHLVLGALVTRPLIESRHPDRAYLRRYVDAVLLPALGLNP